MVDEDDLLKIMVKQHRETGHVGSFGDKSCPLCNDGNKAS